MDNELLRTARRQLQELRSTMSLIQARPAWRGAASLPLSEICEHPLRQLDVAIEGVRDNIPPVLA